ncbi:hypothetical protein NMG60_11008607, partial [Bertholletia excelsa]
MLGGFITRGLVLIIGYAYPAFECFKIVEKNKVEIEELRFWCQYWIIVAMLTAFERIGDILVSWLPLYGEMKLVLLIYLWHPSTKGTSYVYGTLLKPHISRHEPDIDRKIQELKARAWDMTVHYWQNTAKAGQSTIFQMIQYLAAYQSGVTMGLHKPLQKQEKYENAEAPPPTPTGSPSFRRLSSKNRQSSLVRRPPLPPTPLGSFNRSAVNSPKSEAVHLHKQAEFIHNPDELEPDSAIGSGSPSESDDNGESK